MSTYSNLSDLNITIIRKKPLKYSRISIKDDLSVRITVPTYFSDNKVQKIIEEKNIWIQKNLAKMKARKKLTDNFGEDEVFYMGEKYSVIFINDKNKNIVLNPEKQEIYINTEDQTKYKKILENWFINEAKKYIPLRVKELNETLNYKFNKISIRNQSTRWGSCSGKGNLSFNFRLIKAPQDVMDYVIFHELVHLKEFSHSKKFWSLVETHCPNYKNCKNWLKEKRYLIS